MKIALVDLNSISGLVENSYAYVGENSLRLVTLRQILNEAGYSHVRIIPPSLTPEQIHSPNLILENIDKTIGEFQPDVICMSVDSIVYPITVRMAAKWRARFPDVKILMGGPHFQEVGLDRAESLDVVSPILQPISYTLTLNDRGSHIADAVVTGPAGNLGAIIKSLHEGNPLPAGAYWMDGGRIHGFSSGVSTRPRLSKVPTVKSTVDADGHYDLMVLADNSCSNGCDFCALQDKFHYSEEEVSAAITEALGPRLRRVNFHDPSALLPNRFRYYKKILDLIAEAGLRINARPNYNLCIDPAQLVDPGHRRAIFRLIDEHRVDRFFLGRENPNKLISQLIGSRYKGKLKDQPLLDAEREAIREMIDSAGHQKDARMVLSYILTPWDDQRTFANTRREMIEFFRWGREKGVDIIFSINNFVPLPGTKASSQYKDLYEHNPLCYIDSFEPLFWLKFNRSFPLEAAKFLSSLYQDLTNEGYPAKPAESREELDRLLSLDPVPVDFFPGPHRILRNRQTGLRPTQEALHSLSDY